MSTTEARTHYGAILKALADLSNQHVCDGDLLARDPVLVRVLWIRNAADGLISAALAATSAPSEPAMTEAEDKLHAAICHAVSIMNNSFDIARSTEGREAKDILRRALLDYADALSAAPAVRIFDDRPQLERLAKAEHAMRNPPKLEFEDERAQPEAPAEPIDGALMTDVLGYLRSSQNFKLATRLSEALATPPAEVVVPAELSDAEIEELRKATFSTENPFCPVDAKSMRKAVRATERFLAKSKEKAS